MQDLAGFDTRFLESSRGDNSFPRRKAIVAFAFFLEQSSTIIIGGELLGLQKRSGQYAYSEVISANFI